LLLVFFLLRIMPPKQVSLSPNEGAQIEVVKTIKRNRLKLTVNGGGGGGGGGDVVSDKSFTESYLASLTELERRVCSIAQAHLESSFDLSRSNGYVAWKTK
jgi:hypothetical protein